MKVINHLGDEVMKVFQGVMPGSLSLQLDAFVCLRNLQWILDLHRPSHVFNVRICKRSLLVGTMPKLSVLFIDSNS